MNDQTAGLKTRFNCFPQNEIPLSEHHQVESSSETLANWEEVFAKSRKVDALSSTDDSDKSLIMAAHKIIPAHVSSMVPFGKSTLTAAVPK